MSMVPAEVRFCSMTHTPGESDRRIKRSCPNRQRQSTEAGPFRAWQSLEASTQDLWSFSLRLWPAKSGLQFLHHA